MSIGSLVPVGSLPVNCWVMYSGVRCRLVSVDFYPRNCVLREVGLFSNYEYQICGDRLVRFLGY